MKWRKFLLPLAVSVTGLLSGASSALATPIAADMEDGQRLEGGPPLAASSVRIAPVESDFVLRRSGSARTQLATHYSHSSHSSHWSHSSHYSSY